MFSASGNEREVRKTLGLLGWIAIARGNYSEAQVLCEEALQMSRDAGDKQGVLRAVANLGHAFAREGRLDEALGLQREALLLARGQFDLTSVSDTLVEIASVAIARRDNEPAAVLVGASAAHCEATESTLDPVGLTLYEEILGVLRVEVCSDRLALATARGREMPLDELVAFAAEFIDSQS
jgi:tetratricopeptide (TPR) repeat protein